MFIIIIIIKGKMTGTENDMNEKRKKKCMNYRDLFKIPYLLYFLLLPFSFHSIFRSCHFRLPITTILIFSCEFEYLMQQLFTIFRNRTWSRYHERRKSIIVQHQSFGIIFADNSFTSTLKVNLKSTSLFYTTFLLGKF